MGCNTQEEPGDVIFSKFERIHEVLTKDTWKVEEFAINEIPHTGNFENYIFRFNNDQTVVIQKDSVAIMGNWMYKSLPFEGELLEISLPTDSVLHVLSETWKMDAVINRQVKLSLKNDMISKNLIFERL